MTDLEAFLATTWTPPPISDGPTDVVGSLRALRDRPYQMQPEPARPPVHPVTGWPFEGLIRDYRESETT